MNTAFHFTSAQEITPAILDVIKGAYQAKPISIYIEEDAPFVPAWQMQEVRYRDEITANNSACFLDCDAVIAELEQELEAV